LGRDKSTSDQFGEKLTGIFVTEVFEELFRGRKPRFALLAPDNNEDGYRYTLYIQGEIESHWQEVLDHALCRNPHYAYCRRLGQLLQTAIFCIKSAYEAFAQYQAGNGARLGDIKPVALSCFTGWSNVFSGVYCANIPMNLHLIKARLSNCRLNP
jgi:hypothetical protein